jgi:hypothetical protein
MRLVLIISMIFSTTAFAVNCTDPFEGKWKCDTDIFGKEVELKILPSGHGLDSNMLAIVNSQAKRTEISAILNFRWTTSPDYFPVRGSCKSDGSIKIEFKDREMNYRRASGVIVLVFETSRLNDSNDLHIYEDVKFANGENFTINATCRR